jgi:hypothetical protein
VRDGETLTTDGPFADRRSRSAATTSSRQKASTTIAVAARIPAAEHGAVEVRPLVER